MKKGLSHFASLALAALAFSSCSRADYATNSVASPLTQASVAQAPAAAAELSATVVAAKQPTATAAPAPAVASAAPVATPAAPRHAAATTAAPATALAATSAQPAAQATKPGLVQRLALQKVARQLTKMESRQQNTASVEHTAAHGKSLTILLIGLVALLLGIIIGAGWLTTVGAIIAAIGLILLLLKAL